MPKATATKPLRVPEANIEQTCTQLLEWDGWRSFKMEENFSERKKKRTGEPGMADRLYIRYGSLSNVNLGTIPEPAFRSGHCEVMWIEWKALDGKRSNAQADWHDAERALGALVLCAGINFPASIEGFREWYKKSGLMRRSI